MSTFTLTTIGTLSGGGTLRLASGTFPTITTNNFAASAASGATVEYYSFTGSIPVSIDYPNLTFTNTTGAPHTIAFSSASAYTLTISGSLVTQAISTGSLTVNFGTAANVITIGIAGNVTIGANTRLAAGVHSPRSIP
jgi:fibronectin-binding autotransporter adhesin